MLYVFISVPASLPLYTPISPSINEVRAHQVRLIDYNKNIFTSNHCPPVSGSMDIRPKMISIAMSNIDGFKPNHLLQQMYKTQVLDEDVDLGLSNEELESVAGKTTSVVATDANTQCSDVFVNNTRIIDINEFLKVGSDPNAQLDYICNRLPDPINQQCCLDQKIPCPGGRNDRNTAEVIRQQLVAPGVKQRYPNGFNIVLETGQVIPR